jgi:hypothetical protein
MVVRTIPLPKTKNTGIAKRHEALFSTHVFQAIDQHSSNLTTIPYAVSELADCHCTFSSACGQLFTCVNCSLWFLRAGSLVFYFTFLFRQWKERISVSLFGPGRALI